MSSPNDVKPVASEGVTSLPPRELLRQMLASHIVEIPKDREMVRAVWNEGSVWPQSVHRVYRFGPPESMKAPLASRSSGYTQPMSRSPPCGKRDSASIRLRTRDALCLRLTRPMV